MKWLKAFWEALKASFLWFVRILEDGKGNPSSKRIQSFILLTCGVIMAFARYDWNIVAVTFGAALGLQGVTAFQR